MTSSTRTFLLLSYFRYPSDSPFQPGHQDLPGVELLGHRPVDQVRRHRHPQEERRHYRHRHDPPVPRERRLQGVRQGNRREDRQQRRSPQHHEESVLEAQEPVFQHWRCVLLLLLEDL